MTGCYDNELGEFVEEECLGSDRALWLEDEEGNLYIVPPLTTPDGTLLIAENEGPDGPVMDRLNRIIRENNRLPTETEYEALGLQYISPALYRFSPEDGYYHA